ncbi:hypothetical protein JB92DRAFT_2906598 [Gautieria morchelliformis]|nr:hypothetical protein JB92DRAFT_2906598 [Gautieria morchelliformis]
MPISLWLASQREVDHSIAIVTDDPLYSAQEVTEDYDEFVERSLADEKDGVVRIHGSIISFVDRLDDEFTKSLRRISTRTAQNMLIGSRARQGFTRAFSKRNLYVPRVGVPSSSWVWRSILRVENVDDDISE